MPKWKPESKAQEMKESKKHEKGESKAKEKSEHFKPFKKGGKK